MAIPALILEAEMEAARNMTLNQVKQSRRGESSIRVSCFATWLKKALAGTTTPHAGIALFRRHFSAANRLTLKELCQMRKAVEFKQCATLGGRCQLGMFQHPRVLVEEENRIEPGCQRRIHVALRAVADHP